MNSFNTVFPKAYDDLGLSATFRDQPGDFYVEENLGFDLSGDGEHLCLWVEKQSHNTHWVAAELARYIGVSERDIGVCGRKDRHAITRQWFSIYDAERRNIDWNSFSVEGIKVLESQRHHKKLRLGCHQSNHFVIRLRQVLDASQQLLAIEKQQQVLEYIYHVFSCGVPNYFGPQRFGRDANNLLMAQQWFVDGKLPPRKQKSMVLSAARSYLFNRVLAYRVTRNNWQQLIEGDMPANGQPTGPLWGRGRLASSSQTLAIEQEVLNQYSQWCERMEHQGLKQERRSLMLQPTEYSALWQNNDLIVSFTLPVGTFATSVLAELLLLNG